MQPNELFMEYLSLNNIFVQLLDLPSRVKGMTVKRADNYIVLINEKLDSFQREKTLSHELAHIELGHLEFDQLVDRYPMLEKEVKDKIL